MSVQGKKLQTRSSSKKTETKEETAEKVKALREKQGLWMKEREASKSSSSKNKSLRREQVALPDVPKSRTPMSSGSTPDSSNRNPYSNPRRKPLYPEPKRDHSDVVSWIAKADNPLAKKQRPPSASGKYANSSRSALNTRDSNKESRTSKEYLASNYGGPGLDGSSSNPVLSASKQTLHNKLRPSSRSSVISDTGDQEDDKLDNRIFSRGDVDFLDGDASVSASGIVNKSVDQPHSGGLINSNNFTGMKSQDLSADMLNALADTVAERLKATLQPTHKQASAHQNGTSRDSDSSIASHLCPLCKEPMNAPRHTPMAAIPCGHTYCQTCLRDCRKCPTCQTVVRSTAVNTVLQQIIADFKAQKEKERLQKLEEQTRHYVEEYQSLALRCNALNGEAESILDTMEAVTEQLLDEKKLMKKLEVDEQELKQKIHRLQTELDGIKVRGEDCQERCQDLEHKYNEEKQRLSMIEDTVRTIAKSKERVKLMVHNFAPALNLDDYD